MSIEWYEHHADEFAIDALGIDLSDLTARFLTELPHPARILDLGCGPGRDAKTFSQAGHDVLAIDASPEMVRRAVQHAGVRARVGRAQDLDYTEYFDGIWACASLLHVPRSESADAFERIARALVPGGVLYVSFKRGHGEEERGGRFFHDLSSSQLEHMLVATGLRIIEVWETRDRRPERTSSWWVNGLARRP